MDEETLEYVEQHFQTLTALQKLEIVAALFANAAATGVNENEVMGIQQFLTQIEVTTRQIRANFAN